jgi:hypothetical protein
VPGHSITYATRYDSFVFFVVCLSIYLISNKKYNNKKQLLIDTKQDAKKIVPANNNSNKKEYIPVGHTILYNKGRITWKGEEKTQITKQENNKKS